MPEAFGLYVILTDPVAGYEACARAAVAEGVRYLQLRMKDAPRDEVIDVARRLREITDGADTLLIINDDPAIAAEVDADGVHLGQDDVSLEQARAVWPAAGKRFGLSTHNEAQALAARDLGPDYIGVGPIFATPTKAVPDPVLGLERMADIISGSPLTAVAIGGINEGNLTDVLAHGAANFAVVRAVTRCPEPQQAIRSLMDTWRSHRPPQGGRKC